MKRTIILIFIIIMFLIYSGCDRVDNPLEPVKEDTNNFNCSINEIDNEYFYIYEESGIGYVIPQGLLPDDVDFGTYIRVNPQFTHYLYEIREWVENDYIEFYNPEVKKAYLNKLDVVINMCEDWNLKGAENKLKNDLMNYSSLWISNQNQKEGLGLLFDLTLWMIQNPDEDLYVPEAIIKKITFTKTTVVRKGDKLITTTCTITQIWLFEKILIYESKDCTVIIEPISITT